MFIKELTNKYIYNIDESHFLVLEFKNFFILIFSFFLIIYILLFISKNLNKTKVSSRKI